jgi:hypothetical protein
MKSNPKTRGKAMETTNGASTTARYEFWTNDETWLTHKWVTDDARNRRRWLGRAARLAGKSAGPAELNQAIHELAREIRDSVHDECCAYIASLADDLLSSALARVQWREVAKIILGEIVPAAVSFDWLFPFGTIMETAGVLNQIPTEERLDAVARHARGDWGEADGVDWSENDSAVRQGGRVFSEFRSKAGVIFFVVTAADRKTTTVLLADEH